MHIRCTISCAKKLFQFCSSFRGQLQLIMDSNVKSIAGAENNVHAIETWLGHIAQQRVVRKQANVQFSDPMPSTTELSQVFREAEDNKLRRQYGTILKHSLLNLSLEDYIDVNAALLGIPVYADDRQQQSTNDKARTHAVYLMFSLYMQFAQFQK